MQDLSIKFMTPKLKLHILDNFPGSLTNKSSHSQGSNRTQFFVWSNSSQTVYRQCTWSIALSCNWSNGTAWKRKKWNLTQTNISLSKHHLKTNTHIFLKTA